MFKPGNVHDLEKLKGFDKIKSSGQLLSLLLASEWTGERRLVTCKTNRPMKPVFEMREINL